MRLEPLQRSVGWVIGFGVLLIVLGTLAVLAPLVAGIAIETLVGSLFLLGGIAEIIYALRATAWGAGLLSFASGALSIACGLLMLIHPLLGLSFLTLLLAGYFLADGVSRIVLALQMRTVPGWQWMLVNGIVTLFLAGFIIAEWPLSGAWAIGILAGVNILLTGWALTASGLAAKNLLAAR
jgi:uncharacterized membrane protein HdeD (DUF308 family)